MLGQTYAVDVVLVLTSGVVESICMQTQYLSLVAI